MPIGARIPSLPPRGDTRCTSRTSLAPAPCGALLRRCVPPPSAPHCSPAPARPRPRPRPQAPARRPRPAPRSSATSPTGASTTASTSSRTSRRPARPTKLTHINYAFGNVTDGKCALGDAFADTDKAYTAGESVDGVADTWDQPLRGNFNQLRKLKKLHPDLKVLWSFGGWSWSGGFGEAAKDPAAFAQSCYDLVENSKWADVFDGIDIDWEYPNACGLTCDTSGRDAFPELMKALRAKFGKRQSGHRGDHGRRERRRQDRRGDYAGAAQYVDWYNPMTYDYFGAWAATGPTAPHSPLHSYPGIPKDGYNSAATIAKLKGLGIPASKLLLGIGFYGRGWTGVTQAAPGGTATGPAKGTYEDGFEDYKVLKTSCPATGTVGGTAYAKCGDDWWSYDTPATIATKMKYKNRAGAGRDLLLGAERGHVQR